MKRSAMMALLALVLILVALASITFGSRDITFTTVVDAFFHYDPNTVGHAVVRDMRVPRTLLGIFAGAALGLAGTLLQGVTRNPLADPGIMGINSGAAVFIVAATMIFGVASLYQYIWFGFAGAAIAVALVYSIASFGREGATPVKLALAGAAVTAAASSIVSAIILINADALNELRFWQVGSLAGRYMPVFNQVVWFLVVGIVIALFLARPLNGLALGDEVARGLGQNVKRTRALVFITVALLAGAATAAVGPIVFVGLIVPHLARMIAGPDYRSILAISVVLTPIVLLLADIAGRLIGSPGEIQVGVMLGIFGAPFFVALVRYRQLAQL